MLQKVHCLCKLVNHVVFPENMGPIDNSKYPGIDWMCWMLELDVCWMFLKWAQHFIHQFLIYCPKLHELHFSINTQTSI